MATLNGCTCYDVRAYSLSHGDKKPMPDNWKCISCVGRSKSKNHCVSCGVGVYPHEFDENRNEHLCSECCEFRYPNFY